MSGDAARVSVTVAVAPAIAFSIFTEEIDLWWRTGPAYRIAGRRPGRLVFETGPNGRLFETYELPAGPRSFEVGRVLEWAPPSHLSFEWRGVDFKPDERTVVTVDFEAHGDGTLVTVVHRGFGALREGHPVRHGLEGAAFSRMIGLWWGGLMQSFRRHVAVAHGGLAGRG